MSSVSTFDPEKMRRETERLARSLGLKIVYCRSHEIPREAVSRDLKVVGYDGKGTIYVRSRGGKPQWREALHEIAHWLVASEEQRRTPNFGLEAHDKVADEIEALEDQASEINIGLCLVLGGTRTQAYDVARWLYVSPVASAQKRLYQLYEGKQTAPRGSKALDTWFHNLRCQAQAILAKEEKRRRNEDGDEGEDGGERGASSGAARATEGS